MPNVLDNLVIDRVDFVNEGANSAAFIEIYKRKGQEKPMEFSEILSKMKPEHSAVIQQELDAVKSQLSTVESELNKAKDTIAEQATELGTVKEDLAKANETITQQSEELEKSKQCDCDGQADENGKCTSCGRMKKSTGFDETEVLKSMPEGARNEFLKMRAQKEAAEEQVRKAAEEKREAEAIAKAATLKSLPVDQEKLVAIIKNCDESVVDVLTAVATAIDTSVLGELGKSRDGGSGTTDDSAWGKIEAEADKVAARDSVSKQKAIATVIKEQPELYKEYLNGGAN